jgi:hypothetical protein
VVVCPSFRLRSKGPWNTADVAEAEDTVAEVKAFKTQSGNTLGEESH